MVKRNVELIFCDEEICKKSWETSTVGKKCMFCQNDLCEAHAYKLTSSFLCGDLDTAFVLGNLCIACKTALSPVLDGAKNVINERLKGLVTECVKDYAVRLRAEKEA